jgi:hypothetical protein
MSDQQSNFEGWAILEIFGHQKYAGFVKTEYYGTACMFRCDVPPLKERERITRSGLRVETPDDPNVHVWAPPGSSVKHCATQGYSKLFGVGAIYSMTPCDEAAALRAVEELQPRSLMLVSLPPEKALAAAAEPQDIDFKCCAGNPHDGHEIGCLHADDEPDAADDFEAV